jgi:preprotein translocase subunit SecA
MSREVQAGRPARTVRARIRSFLQQPGSADLSRYWKVLPEIAEREVRVRNLSDAELILAASECTDDLELCALGREAARRGLGQRPYDVQMLGVLVMLDGQVAEMATGEGKTLCGALAAAGHALRGRSVQVWSVNDYLARRDAEWMRPVYAALGVSVGWIGQTSTPAERRTAYSAQVTYAPVSEIGFDVLRDRICTEVADLVAGAPDVVLIDEADSVLVDEAMVPLVLAGTREEERLGRDVTEIVRGLSPGRDFEVDEDARNVLLTEAGALAAERALGGIELYTSEHADVLSRLNVALHARALLHRDVDYLVVDGRIHLINESRGRVARLQRWPDGLHAAVEAKEGLSASESGAILDSLTVQSLVRRYPTVCGMTGTAVAVGSELREFYGLEVAVIPTHRPVVRVVEPDRVYATVEDKEAAIVQEVSVSHAAGRPVLLGTLDVAESERLADLLRRRGLECQILNAKNDAAEAAIIAGAGAAGAITVSTQMAGRGTDIRLGGSAEDPDAVAAIGGLQVIGTGRHASSRLDEQLRGRCGRQGDPGSSVVFASEQDTLMLKYGSRVSWNEAAPAALNRAQRIAEADRFEIHRNTWRYHQLLGDQRRIVLEHRERVLRTDAAFEALSVSCPDRATELSSRWERDVLVRAARQVVLWHLDQRWADHLAQVADLRESIHLRALGRGLNPMDEFNRELIRLFTPLVDEIDERSAAMFRTVPITPDGADLGAAGLIRPTATWTYLVQDNPFGSDIDRALGTIGRALRGRGPDPRPTD